MPKKKAKRPFNVSIIGPPLSGKGTQADKLTEVLQLPHLVMSQLLKAAAKKGDKESKIIQETMARGELVPSSIQFRVLRDGITHKNVSQGFIIEGVPRRYQEALYFNSLVDVDFLIHIALPVKELIKRASGRRQCSCGATYSLVYKPPKKAGLCDLCGQKLFIRPDDKPAVIKRRMVFYNKEIKGIAKLYQKENKFIEINGAQSIEQVFQEILRKIIYFLQNQ
ncbi:MAG: nucleoside monophosphate kinase [Candidatus Buchananbacteria bacterium]